MKDRTWLLIPALVLLAVVVAGLLVLLAYPTLLTGGFYEISIDDVTFDTRGFVNLEYHARLAYRTMVAWGFPGDSGVTRPARQASTAWNPPFLGWPSKEPDQTLGIWMTSKEERDQGITDSPSLRTRLLVEKGKTYRIRVGERFVYCRRLAPDGKAVEASIEVIRQP